MTKPLHINLQGEEVPVKMRRNAQARRMVLRVCPSTGEIRLTVPTRARMASATRFVESHLDWIRQERDKAASNRPLGHGDALPFLGAMRTLVYTDASPRKVVAAADTLSVGGPRDLAPKRLEAWLKREAKDQLTVACEAHAATLGALYNRISIGDMKSRWGSCSSRGTLRFNWRLILAPVDVLDYVAAHEVAHLLEMNHSDRFWACVARCKPDYGVQRQWLKKQGGRLFSVRL